jgi:hypothetical protein
MATHEPTIHSFPAQGRTPLTITSDEDPQIDCAHCGQPTTAGKRITVDRNVYCKKLCAAPGLFQSAWDEDGIDPDTGIDALTTLVEAALSGNPPEEMPIPTRVRDCDSEAALELLHSGPLGHRLFMIAVGDEGTPDWVPDPIAAKAVPRVYRAEPGQSEQAESDRTQGEIDRVVESLLRNGNEPEKGRP